MLKQNANLATWPVDFEARGSPCGSTSSSASPMNRPQLPEVCLGSSRASFETREVGGEGSSGISRGSVVNKNDGFRHPQPRFFVCHAAARRVKAGFCRAQTSESTNMLTRNRCQRLHKSARVSFFLCPGENYRRQRMACDAPRLDIFDPILVAHHILALPRDTQMHASVTRHADARERQSTQGFDAKMGRTPHVSFEFRLGGSKDWSK